MKSIADWDKLERRAKLSRAASLIGFVILLAGLGVAFYLPTPGLVSFILLGVGFVVANVGLYYANRWVKKPRPEDRLDEGLKGLAQKSRMYHYVFAADHVLLMDSGIVVIRTVALEGKFAYKNGRWSQKFDLGRLFRPFVDEQLADPIGAAKSDANKIKRLLDDAGVEGVPVEPMVVFTHPTAEVDFDNPPIPVSGTHKLKNSLPLGDPLPDKLYTAARKALDAAGDVED